MALFRWRDNLSLGVASIDADHKKLIDLLNRLHFMSIAGADTDAIGGVLSELVMYTRTHFRREEALMQAVRYPDFAEHQRLHREMTSELATYEAAYATDPKTFDIDAFYDFIADWLLVHVMTVDMKLQPHLTAVRASNTAAA